MVFLVQFGNKDYIKCVAFVIQSRLYGGTQFCIEKSVQKTCLPNYWASFSNYLK